MTLWIAFVAAIGALWVAINGDWQASVREQNRIAAEQIIQRSREETLSAVLTLSAESDQLAYKQIVDEPEYEGWRQQADIFWASAKQRLAPLLTPAEFANAFAPANPSAFNPANAFDDSHGLEIRMLTEFAARLRSISLKYA
ncbi:hypothetical protein DevBK_14590 [Devosia sp. BK]|uniref:hypothetical protein n=1 Tax=Devosia sp. BK TaxID=2871706 RepID=UPI002939F340|nr:hypothetical protein [Devosia sp. BK]MDV3252565.1 hypothetical protein [Devosia sp. BK]